MEEVKTNLRNKYGYKKSRTSRKEFRGLLDQYINYSKFIYSKDKHSKRQHMIEQIYNLYSLIISITDMAVCNVCNLISCF